MLRFLVMLGSMRSHIDHREPGEGVCPRESEARKTDSVSKPVSRVEGRKKRAHLLGINQFAVEDC